MNWAAMRMQGKNLAVRLPLLCVDKVKCRLSAAQVANLSIMSTVSKLYQIWSIRTGWRGA